MSITVMLHSSIPALPQIQPFRVLGVRLRVEGLFRSTETYVDQSVGNTIEKLVRYRG